MSQDIALRRDSVVTAPHGSSPAHADSLVVSLLTVWPGAEVYELDGHSAIRIQDLTAGTDSVWNYGMFDFAQPHFVYRFVKGETDYMVGGYPTAWFLPEYHEAGRRVLEQELNLTQSEAARLRQLLRVESLPQNRVYRYNYVKDNCATRITDRVAQAVGQRIIFPDTLGFGTFRNEMRSFHRDYPWYQFGIDLALGSGLDYDLRPDEEMFVPIVMSERYAGGRMADGRPLVSAEREILPDSGHATQPPTPWYISPLFCCWVCFALIMLLCVWQLRRRSLMRPLYSMWFGLIGLTGCVIAFLVFISTHEATSPNLLLLWLNPLQLLLSICLWWRRSRPLAVAMAWYNIIVLTVLLIVWPFQPQSTNAAFFPLMGATLAMAAVYAILCTKKSYYIDKDKYKLNESHNGHDAGGSGRTHRRRSTGNGRPATNRGRNSR